MTTYTLSTYISLFFSFAQWNDMFFSSPVYWKSMCDSYNHGFFFQFHPVTDSIFFFASFSHFSQSYRRRCISHRCGAQRNGFGKWNVKSGKTSVTQPSSKSRTKNHISAKRRYATGCQTAHRKWRCIRWWHRANLLRDYVLHRIQIHIPLFEHRLWHFRWRELRETTVQTLHQHQPSHNGINRCPVLCVRLANVWLAGNNICARFVSFFLSSFAPFDWSKTWSENKILVQFLNRFISHPTRLGALCYEILFETKAIAIEKANAQRHQRWNGKALGTRTKEAPSSHDGTRSGLFYFSIEKFMSNDCWLFNNFKNLRHLYFTENSSSQICKTFP